MGINTIAISILIVSFFIFIISKVPITFALGFSAALTSLYLGIPLETIAQRMAQGIQSFSLMAIPFFIIAGDIMGQGGISKRLIALANVLIGHVRGGLAMVNVLAAMFFGGISGSSTADTSSIGSILIPMMKEKGYDADYAVNVTTTASIQGILIPPSHNMVIYSMAAGGVSVGGLFLAGFVPGVTLGIALMIISYIIAVKRGYPKEEKKLIRNSLGIIKDGLLGLFTAVIIIGGIISGTFTATESAAVAVVYALIITFFVYKDIPFNWESIKSILTNSMQTLAMVMGLLGTSAAFGWVMAYLHIPAIVATTFTNISSNPIILLMLINVFLLFLGCIMDMAPLILITTPILLPIIISIGVNPIHFGIIMMLNLGIGLLTPPVGSTLFVGCSIGKISIEESMRGIWPFYLTLAIVLVLITYVPAITMTLPNMILGL